MSLLVTEYIGSIYGNKVSIRGMVGTATVGISRVGIAMVGTLTVGGGGCVGGTGVFVGGTEVFVATIRVFVGTTEVRVGLTRVDVGAKVDEAEIVVPVVMSLGSRVRRVAVPANVGVIEGVRVAEGVAVGMVGVIVGRSDAVLVGTVEVGNGPSRASEVSAKAVLVLLAPCSRATSLAGARNTNQNNRKSPKKRIRIAPTRTRDGVVIVVIFHFLHHSTSWYPASMDTQSE